MLQIEMELRDFPKTYCALICIMLVNGTSSCKPCVETGECVLRRSPCKFPNELVQCGSRNTRSAGHELEMSDNTQITINYFKPLEKGFTCDDPDFGMKGTKKKTMDYLRTPSGTKYLEMIKGANVNQLLILVDDLLHYMKTHINVSCCYEKQTVFFMMARLRQTLDISKNITKHDVTNNATKIFEGVYLPQSNSESDKRVQKRIVYAVFQHIYLQLNATLLVCNNTTLKEYTNSLKEQLPTLKVETKRNVSCDNWCMESTTNKFAGKLVKRIQRLSKHTKPRQIFKFYEALYRYTLKHFASSGDSTMNKLIHNLRNSFECRSKNHSHLRLSGNQKDKKIKDANLNHRHKKHQDWMRYELDLIPSKKRRVIIVYIYKQLVRKMNTVLNFKETSLRKSPTRNKKRRS